MEVFLNSYLVTPFSILIIERNIVKTNKNMVIIPYIGRAGIMPSFIRPSIQ